MNKPTFAHITRLFFLAAFAAHLGHSTATGQAITQAGRPAAAANNNPQLVVQLGHSGRINAAAFSPDGLLVVSGGDDPIAIIWEAATGRVIRRLVGHTSGVSAVAFSRDGRFILTGSGEFEFSDETKATPDNSARLWDAATGKELRRFLGHTARIGVVEFSPDGRLVLTASEDGSAGLWSAATGKIIRRFVERGANIARVAKFSPDGRFVLTAGGETTYHRDYTIRLWDASSGVIVQRIVGYEHPVGALAFSPDGQFVLGGAEKPLTGDIDAEDADVRLWNRKTGGEVRSFRAVSPVAFSPDGKLILTGGRLITFQEPRTGATLWDVNTGKKIHEFSFDEPVEEVGVIESLAFSPDGLQAMVVSNPIVEGSGGYTSGSTDLSLYDVTSGKEVRHLQGSAEAVSRVAFSRDNRLIIAGNVLWSSVTGQEIRLHDTKGDDLRKLEIISLSADGRLALTADSKDIAYSHWGGSYGVERATARSNEIRLWDLSSSRQLARFPKAAEGWLSSDGRYVLTMENKEKPESKAKTDAEKEAQKALGADELTARLWETNSGKELWHFDFVANTLSNAGGSYYGDTASNFEWVISPDGRYVVIEGKESTVILNTADGSIASRFDRGTDVLPLLAISPDNRFFATRRPDFVGFVSMRTGKVLWSLRDPAGTTFDTYNLAFSPNGRFLLASGELSKEKGSIEFFELRLFDVATGKELKEFVGQSRSTYAFSPDSRFLLTVDTSANSVNLWNLATAERVQQFAGHLAGVSSVAFSSDQRFVLTGSYDSTTRVWDVSTGQQICRLLSFTDGTWAAIAPDGRFETNNLEEIKGLHWIIPDDPFRPLPLEIFMRDYYEPQLLPRLLKCTTDKEHPCEKEFKPLRDISKLNRVQPPVKISNVSLPDADSYVNVTVEVGRGEGKYLIDGKESTRTTGIYDLRLFRDGQMVGSWPGDGAEKLQQRTATDIESNQKLIGDARFSKELRDWQEATEVRSDRDTSPTVRERSLSKPNYQVKIDPKTGLMTLPPFRVKLPRGKNVSEIDFSTYAFNEDRIKSQTAHWQWPDDLKAKLPKAQPVKPRAYIVAVGVNAYENSDFDLEFAADDARRMAEVLTEKLNATGQYEKVIPVTLVSDYETNGNQKIPTQKQATKDNFRAVLERLAGRNDGGKILDGVKNADQLERATPDDLIIIIYSSHGYADRAGNFYFIPYDTGPGKGKVFTESVRQHSISSDELSLWLRDVDAGDMVMIVDACHSTAAVAGQDFKPGPMGSRGLGQLSYDKGMRILTATQSDNVALENGKLKQGLLTYALVREGIEAGQADFKPKDKTITIAEWLAYGVERVPALYQEVKAFEAKMSTTIPTERSMAENRSQSFGVTGQHTKILLSGNKQLDEVLPGDKGKTPANQQPSLFDFTRKNREVVLVR
jgi:WD40 repeat protein/uncharacterized caspase-like protein